MSRPQSDRTDIVSVKALFNAVSLNLWPINIIYYPALQLLSSSSINAQVLRL